MCFYGVNCEAEKQLGFRSTNAAPSREPWHTEVPPLLGESLLKGGPRGKGEDGLLGNQVTVNLQRVWAECKG